MHEKEKGNFQKYKEVPIRDSDIQLWSNGAFPDSDAGLGNFWKSRVRVRRDSAIKKLLKIFLFIFSIYFYYKNILKKHINILDS